MLKPSLIQTTIDGETLRLLPEDLPPDAPPEVLVLPSHATQAPLRARRRGTEFLLLSPGELASTSHSEAPFHWQPNGKPRHLPTGKARQFIFSSDFGLTKDHNWRPLTEPGALRAPYVSGIALATDGILVAILIGDDSIFIGHLDNWVPNDHEAVTDEEGDVVEITTKQKRRETADAKARRQLEELLA